MNEAKYRTAEKILWSQVGCTPIEEFVPLPLIGVKVRVQEVGEGEPVLFVHGGECWVDLGAVAGVPRRLSLPVG
jgi:hypothetical protein